MILLLYIWKIEQLIEITLLIDFVEHDLRIKTRDHKRNTKEGSGFCSLAKCRICSMRIFASRSNYQQHKRFFLATGVLRWRKIVWVTIRIDYSVSVQAIWIVLTWLLLFYILRWILDSAFWLRFSKFKEAKLSFAISKITRSKQKI